MKEVKHYICEVCGVEYAEKDECEKCEKSHKKAVEIVKMRHLSFSQNQFSQNQKGYPCAIDVKMDDGTIVTYRR